MKIEPLAIDGVLLITPPRFGDGRGFFSETYNEPRFVAAGVTARFMQDNHSLSAQRGVVRGLHCQVAPAVQAKLVRVIRGSIWDVAVDVRVGSPTYGRHVAAVLSAENGTQIYIPGGFLHGFCTLEPQTEVIYKVDAPWDRAAERAVAWDDPDLALPWPIAADEAVLSDKDAALPRLRDCEPWFRL